MTHEHNTMYLQRERGYIMQSVTNVVGRVILEQIEDEYDLELYEKVMAEYRKNPVTYSLDEVKNQLEL
ncbi:toxin-antitoxin system, antitoxin component, ribbon-helix-helix domain protein [Desulfitobacterium hafniense DP7]|uniref:Toxin-antitoxin system, antitoxin component, ribbon-helix-helix domain protein n=2 Tax=Desulfitobacterium hafniense TaxID=49338 RepID=G9XVY9_DESHA|nr:toxin-antitoxin system, antitoxin component, ribbon-helix-helix domain protein [Desulfitobacterium hafniense DP7]